MDEYYEDDFEQYFNSGESSHKQSAIVHSKPAITKKTRQQKITKKTVMATGSSPKDRLLSSKEHELRETQNKLMATMRQIQEIEKENKTLRRMQIRQEKEIHRIGSQEGELPMILQRHNGEVMSLRKQLKLSQLNNSELKRKQSDMSNKMWIILEKKKKLESLAKKRNLLEREHLMMELQETNESIKEKNKKIHELEKAIELTAKTHTHELRSVTTRHKQVQQQLNTTQQYMIDFRHQLKEKERLLDVSNIYSQRVPLTSVLPPLPKMADKGSQTVLTNPPEDKKMVLITKHHTNTMETQTDSKWNIEMFSTTKRNTIITNNPSSNEDTPLPITKPHPPIKPQPITFISSTGSSIATNTTSVSATNQTAVQQQAFNTSISESDNPIIELTPPKQLTTPLAQPTNTHSSTHKYATVTTGATPQQDTSQEMTRKSNALDKKKKDDLMMKLFPSKYEGSTVSSDDTKERMGIKWNGEKDEKENIASVFVTENNTSDISHRRKEESVVTENNTISHRRREESVVKETTGRRVQKESGVFGNDIGLMEDETKRADNNTPLHNRTDSSTETAATDRSKMNNGLLDKLFQTSSNTDQSTSRPSNTSSRPSNIDQSTSRPSNTDQSTSRPSNTSSRPSNTYQSTSRHSNIDQSTSRFEIDGDTSSTSLLSKNERIRNLHQGLPSMASDDDPYGTKRRRSDVLIKETARTNTMTGATTTMTEKRSFTILGRDVGQTTASTTMGEGGTTPVIGGPPKHGRRALDTKNTSNGMGLIFGETPPTNQRTNNIFGGVQSQVGGTYPWEQKVDLPKQDAVSNNNNNNNTVFVLDDDVEELMI